MQKTFHLKHLTHHIFQHEWQPEIKLDLDTSSTQLSEGVYEVVLRVTTTATLGEETAFCVCSRRVFSLSKALKVLKWHIA